MKPEEEEILKILEICLKSQEHIQNTCINKLKKYNPETLKTITPVINTPDNMLSEEFTEILNYEEDPEDDTYTSVERRNFKIRNLYSSLYFKKQREIRLINSYAEDFINRLNLTVTPQEEEEIKKEVEKIIMNTTKELEKTHKN